MIIKALLIPAVRTRPVEVINYNPNNPARLAGLVFGNQPAGVIGVDTFRHAGCQLMYDDNGWANMEPPNERASHLWRHLTQAYGTQLMLCGNYVVLGITKWGDEVDLPQDIIDYAMEDAPK